MKSQWDEEEYTNCGGDPLDQRVYTTRLIGREKDLVLHGGGNSSVKTEVTNVLGETEDVLYARPSQVRDHEIAQRHARAHARSTLCARRRHRIQLPPGASPMRPSCRSSR